MKINIIDLTVTSAYDGKPSFALCRQEGKPLYRQVREKIVEDELNLLLLMIAEIISNLRLSC